MNLYLKDGTINYDDSFQEITAPLLFCSNSVDKDQMDGWVYSFTDNIIVAETGFSYDSMINAGWTNGSELPKNEKQELIINIFEQIPRMKVYK